LERERVFLITGAARGIGRYIAKSFADAGTKLAVVDIRPLDTVARELKEREAETLAITADVTGEAAVRAMMQQVASHYGRIDVLVNNAAIPTHNAWEPHWARIRDMEKSFWDRILDTNLGGTFLCTKHVLPYMEQQRSGHILNLHGGGNPTNVGSAAYVTSKDAIRTFTQYVAEEEREFGIFIGCLGPGGIIATEDAPEEVRQRLPGVEIVGTRFVLAAQAPMELSGQLLRMEEGRLIGDSAHG